MRPGTSTLLSWPVMTRWKPGSCSRRAAWSSSFSMQWLLRCHYSSDMPDVHAGACTFSENDIPSAASITSALLIGLDSFITVCTGARSCR